LVNIDFSAKNKNQAPFFTSKLAPMYISANGDKLKSGEEEQFYIYALPRISDQEGDSPRIWLEEEIPCNCITVDTRGVKIDKKLLSEADVGTHHITL
jgi:hypothetical protein